ncbi:MAG: homogentisate 1,2-dioxygenase [Alphaproteobacteria bacterium]
MREISNEGFFGPASFFYHRRPPTGWTSFEGPLRPRAFNLVQLNTADLSPWDAPVVLHNQATEMRFWTLDRPMNGLARNGDGDQMLFIHQGNADLYCDYGHLFVTAGDYVYLPRGTMWRLMPQAALRILMIQATNTHFTLPDRGMAGPHAVFDPAVLDVPAYDEAFRAHQAQEGETPVFIKKRGQVSVATYPYNPLDAVGWHGNLSVLRLNVKHIRPMMSHRYHLPPSAHTTFLSDRFVICTFCPRPFESDPGAIKIPFFHNNDDYDEVLFYHAGDFFSRDNIEAGMMTFHPCGFTHGPHPKALTKMFTQSKPATDEYAVMLDARDPLDVGSAAEAVEWTGYKDSWKTS